jgi:hypothetical protein
MGACRLRRSTPERRSDPRLRSVSDLRRRFFNTSCLLPLLRDILLADTKVLPDLKVYTERKGHDWGGECPL